MKYYKFDVVKLSNGNKAIILNMQNKKEYFVNIINSNGESLGNKLISYNEIDKLVYSKKRELTI